MGADSQGDRKEKAINEREQRERERKRDTGKGVEAASELEMIK